eukprot:scaffold111430_cov63-Phaeocystis_antarctica.AAC.2
MQGGGRTTTSRVSSSARRTRYARPSRALCAGGLPTTAYCCLNYSLLTPCLLRACSLLTPCLLRDHYVFATRLLLTCLAHAASKSRPDPLRPERQRRPVCFRERRLLVQAPSVWMVALYPCTMPQPLRLFAPDTPTERPTPHVTIDTDEQVSTSTRHIVDLPGKRFVSFRVPWRSPV